MMSKTNQFLRPAFLINLSAAKKTNKLGCSQAVFAFESGPLAALASTGVFFAIMAVVLFSGSVLFAENGATGEIAPVSVNTADISRLLQDLDSDSQSQQIVAIDQLGSMGSDAALTDSGIVDALVKKLENGSALVQSHAAHALGQIGSAARPAAGQLVALVGSPNETLRRESVRALARIKPDPSLVLPALERLLQDGSPAVRISALHALTELGESAVPLLIEALKSEKTDYWAMLVLAELGPKAKSAVGPLTEKLDSDRPEIRREAFICLGKIGPAAAPAIPALEKLLDKKRGEVVLGVAFVLGSIGPQAREAADRLKPYVADADPLARLTCAWALARTNPHDKIMVRRAARILAESLRSRNPAVRAAAVRGLASLSPGRAIAISAIREALRDPDKSTMDAVLDALASLGKPAVPSLARVLQDKTLCPKAAKILAMMGSEASAAVPALIAALNNADPKTRQEVLFAIASIGPAAAQAAPAVIQALDDEDMDVRYAAVYALGKMGPSATAAEAALSDNLDSPDTFLAMASAWALARIAPRSDVTVEKAVPLLIDALSSDSTAVRIKAAQALALIGNKAKPALPALQKLLDDEQTKAAAQKAIEAIK